MLNHFDKLKTPPKSVRQYPTLSDQVQRFKNRGYSKVSIWDLWEAWSSGQFISSSERMALDDIEPFDEWEEFALFGRHYFVVHASNLQQEEQMPTSRNGNDGGASEETKTCYISVTKHVEVAPKRRFGDAITIKDPAGAAYSLHLMGLGSTGRAESCDIFSLDGRDDMPVVPITGPTPRMCHSFTDLGDYGVLLAGGRTSPANALSDCWILAKAPMCEWVPTASLPIPLFRHAALRLRGSSLVLVVGGKTGPSTISKDIFVFHATKGWLKCTILGEVPGPVFGATLFDSPAQLRHDGMFIGLLAGGIGADGRISSKKFVWKLDTTKSEVSKHGTFAPKDKAAN
jgi:tRNA wybutosine-synthesizing protein 4